MTPTRVPVTRLNPDGTVTDGTAELFGPAVLADLRDLDGQPLLRDDGSMIHIDLDQVVTLGDADAATL